jgi:3-oxoacyl-[acyl-carrier protein] reductase
MSRTALITGASRGIGAATARAFGRRGCHVVVNYRADAEAARRTADEVRAAGGTASLAQADVRDADQVAAMVAGCAAVDVLVCNANIQPPFAPLEEIPWADFIGKVTSELAAVFHITRRVLERMRERETGRIVYVSSMSAELTRPHWIAHATAKSALETFARHVAAEAAPYGIGVNVVAPAAVRTDASAGIATPEYEAGVARRSALHRLLEPDDVAEVVAALAGGEFAAVSGVRVPVDGGARLTP